MDTNYVMVTHYLQCLQFDIWIYIISVGVFFKVISCTCELYPRTARIYFLPPKVVRSYNHDPQTDQ